MIIWISSYPKSGNTWVRSLLSAYYYSPDGTFDFNLLENIKQYPTREFFKKTLKTVEEAAENWLTSQKEIKNQNKKCFLKTHSVYGAYNGKQFTNNEYTLGAINIVRDPRNIITSLMNHYSINEDNALNMISNVHRYLIDSNNKDDYSNYSFISSWSNNYNSWKIAKNINKILIRYEDLESNIEETSSSIIEHTNKLLGKKEKIDSNKLRRSIETTSFDILKEKEKKEGFSEAPFSKTLRERKTFFNLGSENDYKKLLKKKTINSIEKLFFNEMRELGYL